MDPAEIETKEEAETAVYKLREAIRTHNHRYYVEDDPAISDAEYDALMQALQTLEEEYPDLQSDDSPTQQVGGEPQKELGLAEHPTPMLSLKAVYEAAGARDFDETCREALDAETIDYMAELKYDGTAVELVYEDGRFTQAATRGDGDTGEDVTANVKTIRELPLVLRDADEEPVPSQLVVRGEIFMRKDGFNQFNQQRADDGDEPFANPRNAAAGSLRQLDPNVTAERPLHIFLYEVAACDGRDFDTQAEIIETLPRWGLKVNEDASKLCQGIDEALDYHEEMAEKRDDLPYEIDGVVFKVNRLAALYRLAADEIAALEGMGAKSAENLMQEIEASKETPLARFLYALGIPQVWFSIYLRYVYVALYAGVAVLSYRRVRERPFFADADDGCSPWRRHAWTLVELVRQYDRAPFARSRRGRGDRRYGGRR